MQFVTFSPDPQIEMLQSCPKDVLFYISVMLVNTPFSFKRVCRNVLNSAFDFHGMESIVL
jgi:hypothetical protein